MAVDFAGERPFAAETLLLPAFLFKERREGANLGLLRQRNERLFAPPAFLFKTGREGPNFVPLVPQIFYTNGTRSAMLPINHLLIRPQHANTSRAN